MERFSDEVIVLSVLDYGDADRIVTVFGQLHGKLSAFAAGARKSKRRFAGALEPGSLLRAQLVETHGSTVRLDSVEILRSHHALRTDLARLSRALYVVELCRELLKDREAHPLLFESARSYLGLLDDARAGPTSLIAFELEALSHVGLQPRFSDCAICAGQLDGHSQFDVEHGGMVCAGCRARVQRGIPVSLEVVLGLAELQQGLRKPMAPELRARARELLNVFIAHQLGRPLKSVQFMEQVGLD